MRWFRFIVLLLIATILQAEPVNVIAVTNLNIKPNLLVILLVFFAVNYNPSEAIITSFTTGFAADIAAFSLMGPQIISFGLFGTALANLHRVIAIRKVPHQLLAIFVISLLTAITANLLTFLRVQPTTPDIYTLFGTALYSALLGPLLFLPTAWWMRIKKYRFGK